VMLDSYDGIVRSKRLWFLYVAFVIPITFLCCVVMVPFALVLVGIEGLIGLGWFEYIAEEEAIFDAYY